MLAHGPGKKKTVRSLTYVPENNIRHFPRKFLLRIEDDNFNYDDGEIIDLYSMIISISENQPIPLLSPSNVIPHSPTPYVIRPGDRRPPGM